MTKTFILSLLLLMVVGPMWAEKKATLPELMRPDAVIVDNNQLYIVDGIHIYIYSSTDFKLREKAGKEGTGPQEFQKIRLLHLPSLVVHLSLDSMVVSSVGKVAILSRDGKFIKETTPNFPLARFTPLGKKYGVMGRAQEGKTDYITINLYNGNFELEKEIFRFPHFAQDGKKRDPVPLSLMNKGFTWFASADTIFVPTPDGAIHAFNEKGDKVFVIQNRCPKIKISNTLEKQLDKLFSEDFRFKFPYNNDKANNMIEFGEYLPIIKAYRVANQKVYVISYKQNKDTGLYESYVFGADDGKFLKQINIPLKQLNILEEFPFDIHDGKLYQVVENEAEEEWELHVTPIK